MTIGHASERADIHRFSYEQVRLATRSTRNRRRRFARAEGSPITFAGGPALAALFHASAARAASHPRFAEAGGFPTCAAQGPAIVQS